MELAIPLIETDRILLRGPQLEDFPVYRDFYADAEASSFYGGPLEPALAWRRMASDLGHWVLKGYGMWSIIEQGSGEMIGGCGLVWPDTWPRCELTWWVIPKARRNGYALEASQAIIAHAYDEWNWPEVETHMDDNNQAAQSLANKLGGKIIAREAFPDGQERDIYLLPRQIRE